MKINRNNYEFFFLDYLDGNLTDKEIQMLENFLLLHPDLRTELEGAEKASLHPDNIIFNGKELLKKPDLGLPVSEDNFEDFCIAESEGDLNQQQQLALEKFILVHPESEKRHLLFSKLHLVPDQKIVFPRKGELKKAVFFVPGKILYPVLSVAAAIAFMMLIYFSNEDSYRNISDIAADLPASFYIIPPTDSVDLIKQDVDMEVDKPVVIQQASVISLSLPKEKRQTPSIKTGESQDKTDDENKTRNILPPQKLNPSFQIKLPSLADNTIPVPSIERGRITSVNVTEAQNSEEYMSLSDYARKQLSEKVLGNNDPGNTRLTAWQVADAGINGINKLTGGKMKLEKRTDADGSLTAYSFNSKLLSFSTTAVK